MKTHEATTDDALASRSLAPEDLKRGDFVTILNEIVEWPSFLWHADPQILRPDEPVRLMRHPDDGGTPLKVRAICLPFVFVKNPTGQQRILDVRRQRLVRLSDKYARTVWKAMQNRKLLSSTL